MPRPKSNAWVKKAKKAVKKPKVEIQEPEEDVELQEEASRALSRRVAEERARAKLAALGASRPHFATAVRLCELQRASKGLRLPALLIKPVQRVPRYLLLLRDIGKRAARAARA